MPYHYCLFGGGGSRGQATARTVGRPRRNRAAVKAGRKAARRNR